jgi:hypothetical protein
MEGIQAVDASAPSRLLLRQMRERGTRISEVNDTLPESQLWQLYCVLRNRGEDRADELFLRGLQNLHRRRSLSTCDLPNADPDPAEHRMIDDPMLSELWRAYKRCICAQRVGPASQLLREIQDQLSLAH